MKYKNIGIIDINQHAPGIGGVETVGYLLKEELIKKGYSVWTIFFTQKTKKSNTDIQFPDKDTFDSIVNQNFLIKTITNLNIEILIIQGGYKEELLKLCVETKKKTPIKLILPIHFHPLMGIKEYDDYKERFIRGSKNSITRAVRCMYCKLKQVIFTKKQIRHIEKSYKNPYYNNIDAFVTLNNEYTKIIKSFIDSNTKGKFYTITNPLIINGQMESSNKENIILFVGRLTAQKRVDRLLYIWKALHTRNPEWKIVIVGDGEYANEYKQLSKKLQLKNVEFAGQQPSKEFFKKGKIVCITSSHEAQPMVLIEAQQWGCVPIAYNSFESATDIIQDKYNGVLVKPFKQEEYAKKLSELMINEVYWMRLANNGSKFIKKFDINAVIKNWINLFNNL